MNAISGARDRVPEQTAGIMYSSETKCRRRDWRYPTASATVLIRRSSARLPADAVIALPILVLLAAIYLASAWQTKDYALVEATAEKDVAQAKVENLEKPDRSILPATHRENYTVYVQFAGYKRETVVDAAQLLSSQYHWKIPVPEKGGQRTSATAGENLIKIGTEENRSAAAQLAADVLKTGLVNKLPQITLDPTITARNLEIWVGLQ
ncbi:hypothetical protein ACVIRO_007636 [Rhizobium ruizarguesonis]